MNAQYLTCLICRFIMRRARFSSGVSAALRRSYIFSRYAYLRLVNLTGPNERQAQTNSTREVDLKVDQTEIDIPTLSSSKKARGKYMQFMLLLFTM